MFADTLSISMLQLCEKNQINYVMAAKQCNISSSYYASIAKKRASPTMHILEKLCNGFQVTPNDLLLPTELSSELNYRKPMCVTHAQIYSWRDGYTIYPICPRCGLSFEREYQKYCNCCGQHLHWKNFSKAIIVYPHKQ